MQDENSRRVTITGGDTSLTSERLLNKEFVKKPPLTGLHKTKGGRSEEGVVRLGLNFNEAPRLECSC